MFDVSVDTVTKTVTVKYQDNDVSYINELEYINGEVWANVWQVRVVMHYLDHIAFMFYYIDQDLKDQNIFISNTLVLMLKCSLVSFMRFKFNN